MVSNLIDEYNEGKILCKVDLVMRIIGGKWKPIILWHLGLQGKLRYGELKKTLKQITPKMLTQQLRELEEFDMVNRKVYHQVPPKVEYSLTERGKTIIPLLERMCDWGEENILSYHT
jgi:DNA-binding HxlR family transcriptional regulator